MTEGHANPWRKNLSRFLAAIQPRSVDAVILVGSRARGTAIEGLSDVDVLVIAGNGQSPRFPDIQVIRMSGEDLLRRLESGDDFAQWALRFGVPLAGRDAWFRLRNRLLELDGWPDADKKLGQARQHLRLCEELLEMGDLDAAQEELLLALSHVARSELLSRGDFPLSRPELPGQLRQIGDSDLARALELAHTNEPLGIQVLRDAAQLLRSRLTG